MCFYVNIKCYIFEDELFMHILLYVLNPDLDKKTMKRLKKQFWKNSNALITLVLSLLGFSTACESLDEYGAPVVEYGVPTATFTVKGKVTSTENTSIPNIQVSMWGDTAFTDKDGDYKLSHTNSTSESIPIKFEDIDGIENGEYAPLDTVANFQDAEYTGGDGNWNMGEAESELDIKLDSKK